MIAARCTSPLRLGCLLFRHSAQRSRVGTVLWEPGTELSFIVVFGVGLAVSTASLTSRIAFGRFQSMKSCRQVSNPFLVYLVLDAWIRAFKSKRSPEGLRRMSRLKRRTAVGFDRSRIRERGALFLGHDAENALQFYRFTSRG